jgi:hypothetical protein
VAEYRAIFGGAGADLGLLGAVRTKIVSHWLRKRDECMIGAVFEAKRRFRYTSPGVPGIINLGGSADAGGWNQAHNCIFRGT